jgi:hypothetical protein
MKDWGMVHGVVVDDAGRPVAQATIVVVEGTAPVPEIALLADDHGRFALKLPRGRFTLEAQGDQGAKGRTTIDVEEPTLEARIEVT